MLSPKEPTQLWYTEATREVKKPPDLTSKRNLALMVKIGKRGRGGEKMAAGRDLAAAAERLLILILILI